MGERPLRILQVLRAPIGGLFRHVADLSEALAERGHALGVVVDSLTSDAGTKARLDRLRPVADLGIHAFPMPRVLGSGDIRTPLAIGRLADGLAIDVIHGHGAKGGFNARLARGRSGKRVSLYTPHGGVLHFSPRSPAGILFRFLEQRLMARTDAMIFESAFARDAFSRQIVVPTCPAPVIHNGLARAEFVPVTPRADAADFAFVGELRRLKGVFTLVEALANLSAEGAAPSLVMAGDGPDRSELEQALAAAGLTERVKLLGVVPARSVFEQGRCIVVPSLAESLPYIVLEAAAAGRPVIATAVGGIAEIFGPTAGSLIPPGDAGALAAALRHVRDHEEDARAQAADRLAHVRDSFSLATMTDTIEALYHSLIGTA